MPVTSFHDVTPAKFVFSLIFLVPGVTSPNQFHVWAIPLCITLIPSTSKVHNRVLEIAVLPKIGDEVADPISKLVAGWKVVVLFLTKGCSFVWARKKKKEYILVSTPVPTKRLHGILFYGWRVRCVTHNIHFHSVLIFNPWSFTSNRLTSCWCNTSAREWFSVTVQHVNTGQQVISQSANLRLLFLFKD